MLRVVLVTRGSPAQITGGHLFHRRMAEAAPTRDASIEFAVTRGVGKPWRHAPGLVLIDSITAWSVAPWMLLDRRRAPFAAILHQPPGGVGVGSMHRTIQRPFDQAAYRRCDLLIAASATLGRTLVSDYGLPAERICVVEPGSDFPRSEPDGPELRLGRNIALLSVANWLPNKGVLELLDAFAGLPQACATLHLVGRDDVDPGYSMRVRSRLAAPQLGDRVVVHGAVSREHVASLYSGADAFVVPSYEETYGTVHGEALAAGLPTVGWRSGNLPNLIEDGCQGCLVEPGDVLALGSVLHRLATDDVWRAKLATAARDRGRQLPTWDQAADTFFYALNRLASRRD